MPQRRWHLAEAAVIHKWELTSDERQQALNPLERCSFSALSSMGLGLRDWQLQEMAAATGAPRSRLADRNFVREHLLRSFESGQLVGLKRLPASSQAAGSAPRQASLAPGAPGGAISTESVFQGLLPGLHFETDKSFLLPSAIPGLRRIKSFYDVHASSTVLVVGHTDRTGEEAYNLTLSEERAEAVAAFLKEDFAVWMDWYGSHRPISKRWGTREDQHMLTALPSDSAPFFAGRVNGLNSEEHETAVRRFQQWSNTTRGTQLEIDGKVGPATREALIRAYLALDGTTLPEGVTLITHGCGEFHPVEATKDGVGSAANRRVELFFFPQQVRPAPTRCSAPGCSSYAQWLASVKQVIDAAPAPGRDVLEGRLTYSDGTPAANVPFLVKTADGRTISGQTSADGSYRVEGVTGEAQFSLVDLTSQG